MTSRGMMAENMFNGKGVILGWLNSSFALKLEKIEDVREIGPRGACHVASCAAIFLGRVRRDGAPCALSEADAVRARTVHRHARVPWRARS